MDAVFFLGDLTHKRGFNYTDDYNYAFRGLTKIAEYAPLYLIPGNHDQMDKGGTHHALEPFMAIKDVTVISAPYIVADKNQELLLCPYMSDPTRLRDTLRSTSWDMAFVHAGFDGATVGGFEYRPKEELKANAYKGRRIFSGHYHTPQAVGSVVYVGAPMQHIRSDAGEDRGVMLVDTKSGAFSRFPLDAPKFVTLTDEDIAEKDPDDWGVKGNFVDVLLREEPHGGIKRFRELMQQLPARGVNVIYVPPAKAVHSSRMKLTPAMDLPTMTAQYIKEKAPSNLDVAKLQEIVKGLL